MDEESSCPGCPRCERAMFVFVRKGNTTLWLCPPCDETLTTVRIPAPEVPDEG